uniref:Uncharacterized protein n=1 Tax=Phlebotomus papatasi TaxID=29031 RepID=A0A1B0DPZ1_PHLPP
MELISILKRKSTSSENVDVASSLTPSEDSHKKDDDESDSDWDGFPDSQKSSSGFDMSETETLLKEVSDIIPSRLTSGHSNVLLHYVQLEIGEGILLAPTNTQNTELIRTFRQTCFLIHTVLQNTIRFRQLLTSITVHRQVEQCKNLFLFFLSHHSRKQDSQSPTLTLCCADENPATITRSPSGKGQVAMPRRDSLTDVRRPNLCLRAGSIGRVSSLICPVDVSRKVTLFSPLGT